MTALGAFPTACALNGFSPCFSVAQACLLLQCRSNGLQASILLLQGLYGHRIHLSQPLQVAYNIIAAVTASHTVRQVKDLKCCGQVPTRKLMRDDFLDEGHPFLQQAAGRQGESPKKYAGVDPQSIVLTTQYNIYFHMRTVAMAP